MVFSNSGNGVCQTYYLTLTPVFQMCSPSLNGCSMHNSGRQMCFLLLDNVCKIVKNVSFSLNGVFHVAKFLANLQSGSIRNSDTDRQESAPLPTCQIGNMPNSQHAKQPTRQLANMPNNQHAKQPKHAKQPTCQIANMPNRQHTK
jgi:hypothetical protein